jgi:hypothetical protein
MTQIESALCGLYIIGILAVLFAVPAATQESEDLNFASGLEQFQSIRGMLPSYLDSIGPQMLTQRQRQISGWSPSKM